ncbi:MAG: LLM class flavin-dependent oxidoreductase [Nitrososphaerales archaeon]
MNFGYFIPTFGLYEEPNWNVIKDHFLIVDKSPFNSAWIADHFVWGINNAMLECWTLLTALASLTERVRIGCGMLCQSYRNPALVAKMGATLDLISKGRLEFGLGAGWKKDEYIQYGFDYPHYKVRAEQLREALTIVRSLWTKDKVTYNGKYYKVKDAVCEPKPLQKPYPPLWVGGSGDEVLRITAEFADGWDAPASDPSGVGGGGIWATDSTLFNSLTKLENYCKEFGRDFKRIQKSMNIWICISENESKLMDLFLKWRKALKSIKPYSELIKGEITLESAKRNCIFGTPNDCIEKIKSFKEIGLTQLVLGFADYPSIEGFELFIKRVAPKF